MRGDVRCTENGPIGVEGRAVQRFRQGDEQARILDNTTSMSRSGSDDVRAGLADHLTRLWRYGLILSRRRDTAEDLVQATCVRALERSFQYQPGSRLDRWLFAILRSIWLNDLRANRARQGRGLVDAETALTFDGAERMEATVLTRHLLEEISALPDEQREALFLVYGEGLSYREAATILEVPIGTVQSRLAAARLTLASRGKSHHEGKPT